MTECAAWDDIVEKAIDACNKGVPSDNSIGIAWAKCEIDELKARVGRLEKLSESHIYALENAYNQLAVMPLAGNETVISRQCNKDGLTASIKYAKSVLNESPAQSLALHDTGVIDDFIRAYERRKFDTIRLGGRLSSVMEFGRDYICNLNKDSE